jgi:hypothetical protein
MIYSANQLQTLWSAGASESATPLWVAMRGGKTYPMRRRRFALPMHSITTNDNSIPWMPL